MACQQGQASEAVYRELLKWENSKKVVGIYGGYASGKNQICSDLLRHLLQADNRSWNDVCYLSARKHGVTADELFSVEWRSSFFEAAMDRLKTMPKYAIVNDIWSFLDDDQSLMIWSLLTTIAEKVGVVYVADSYLQRIRPWCDILYEVDSEKGELWNLRNR